MKKTSRTSKKRQKQNGQSLVELAITLPVILLLLLGTIDFGMALFTYVVLRDAAQEGALYASFDPRNSVAIENRARGITPHDPESISSSPVDLTDKELVTVTIKANGDKCQGSHGKQQNSIEVSVSYDYPMLMPFAAQVIGSDTIPLTAEATNIILQPPCP
jgi:Flp pilus assembly protein TadG